MAEKIYHDLNIKSPLLDSTGTPSKEATNNAQSVSTFEWDQYLTPYNEIEKGEQANVEPTQKVETPTATKESPLSPSVETPKEEAPKAEAEPMKFDIPTIDDYTEKPTAPTLPTAKTSVVSTPLRKSYKNFYDEYMDVAKHNYALAQSQGYASSEVFGNLASSKNNWGGGDLSMARPTILAQARQYAEAQTMDATEYDIENTLSKQMSGWKSDKTLFSADDILNSIKKVDGDGNEYYQFGAGKIYGDAARKIVKRYVDEHNHWVNMRDKDYRERWSMANYGIPYEGFVDRRMEVKINPALQKLRVAQSAYYNSDEYEMQEEWRRNLSSLDDGFGTSDKDDNLALATQTTFARANSFKDATFANGLIEGMFPAIKSMLPGGVGALDDAALMSEQVIALDKRIKGEPLSKREEYLVALWEANETIDEETNLYRKGGNWAKTASTGLQGIGFSAGIAASGAQQIGNMLGKKLLGEVAEQSALKILKEQGFKTAIKMTAKAAPKKLAVSTATSAVKAGVSSMTARNFAEDRLDQFKMTKLGLMKEEKNPLASLWKAYAMSFGEWFTEDLGDVADDIFSLGRRAALNKVFSGKLSKALTRLDDFKATSAVRNFLRDARIQGLTAEAGSELLNNYIQPLLTGEFFWDISQDGFMSAANKHYSDVLTWESTWDTITQSAIIAGTGMMSRGISGAMQCWQISSLRNQIRETLEDVQNEGLRNQLYELINSDTPNFTPLAGINWKSEGINVEDAQRAMQVVFKSAQVQEMRGEFEETQRLAAFAPQLQYILQRAYKGAYEGVDTEVSTETEALEEIAIKKGDNTFGYVLFGNIDDTNQVLLIVDGNGQTHNVTTGSLKADGYEFDRKSIGDAISEQYALMFSNQISQERLGEVIESVRGYRGADAETKQRIIEANGFSVYKNGSAVTLVDGRMAVVKGNAENGQYTVDILGADGKVADTAMVGFEYIINENDPKMAQAQMDAQARGALGSPIVLPTKEGGRISLDEINDSQTLADLLPSQVGGKAKAVAVIDAEIERLKAMQGSQSKGGGLDAVADNVQQAETIANRIAVLEDTRKRLGGAPKAQPKTREEVAKENEAKQAERDGMSTFEFSQDYRRRMGNTKTSRNALKTFINSIDEGLAVLDETLKDNETAIAKKEAEISNAISRATSEVDLERIAEEQKTAIAKLNTLKAERAEMEADRKKMQHRKAQYEQALKDMGGNTDTKYQEGTIGADKKIFEFAEKASKILGMPVVVTEKEFTSNRQGGLHRVEEDGKRAIYINPNSTAAEQGVGILAHEIGHEFKKVLTPEEWAKFEDLVLTARFGKDWANSEAYKKEIEGIQNAEKSVNGQGISDTKAREEAVTYAIQNFIFDGERGARAFEAILNQDLNWRDKLMEVFRKVVDKLKSLFNVEKPTEQDLAVQSAIEEFGNIFKRCAKKSGEIKAEQIEGETAAIINEKDGQSSFSLSTYEDGGRDILQNFLDSQVEGGKLDQKDANAILTEMDAIYDICMDYKDEYAPFGAWSDAAVVRDEEGMPVFSVIKANGDYAMNLDFSLVCKKRRTLDAVLNEMIGRKLIEIAPDDPTFIAKVNDIVRKYGFETACRLCFVDAKRFRVVSTARNFCKLYNGVVAKLMPTDKKVAINSFDAAGVGYPTHEGSLDTLADSELNIKALEDILKRNGEKTVIAKIARHLLEHPEDRKLVHISDFVSTRGFDPTKALNPQILSLYNSKKGSGGPKASFSDVQYLNDVIYADWNKEDAYAVGGVRVQSFSDYVPRMVFDYMQMVADLAAKQMPVHAYTKEAAFAKTFGLTGMKINMSLVPTVVEGGVAAGLDADGNYAWEEGETFDYDTAIEIQNADGYRENCGTIAVGVSDEHIDKMLDDDNIRMVIPYHKSGLNKAVAIANNIDAFKDYTNQQNTRYADGTKLSSADSKNVPNFNEDTRRLGDPRKAADAYLAWCKENNYKPKFDKWASHPNYYKLLEDFTTLVDGEYFEQRGVTMTFPKEDDAFGSLSNLIAESLEEDAVLEGKRDSLVGAMVDEIESTLFSNREKALESSNSLQKRPNTQEVVRGADVAESYSISRNNEATIDKWLGKREDFTDDIKSAFKEYIADFKPATQLATTKWFANGVIRIPEDMPKVEQAMEIAQRKKVDALQYNSPMELIDQFGDVFKPKAKLINPDDVPTLSNKVQVPNTDITIYDVEDSEESRKNFRELMNSHLGKDANPWCLMQAEDGVLRADSKDYWNQYNKYPKRAAFKGGKLIAFFASADEPTWWSRMDKPYSGIPITRKIEGDALGRSATYIVSEDGGFDTDNFTEIHKGNKHNGLYEEWYDLDTKLSQTTYKDGQIDGLEEKYHDNGRIAFQISYKDGKKDGKYLVFRSDGGLRAEGTYKEGLREGLYRGWHKNGNLKWRGNYINGELDGIVETWDENGNLEMREEYDNGSALIAERYANGKLNGWATRWDKDGDIVSREYYVDGKRNKLQEFGRKVAESFSIDRSQHLEGLEDNRAFASRWMDKIEENVKKNNPYSIALIIDDYDKFATDAEKKLSQGKMSAIDAKYAQETIKTYRAIANYGRAVLAEQFPDYAANAHANNLKSGKTNLAMIRGLFQEYNSDEHMAELFDLVSSVAEKFGTKFRLATLKGNFLGHQRGNLVEYNTATLNSGAISDQDKARIILHEMIHAATMQGVELCDNARLREFLGVYPSTKLRTSVRRLKTLLEDIRNNEEFKGEYGTTNAHEMLAELSNPRFVEKLKKHDIWTRIVDGIREIASAIVNMVTGKDVAKSDAYTEVRTTLTEIIEETPMEFVEGLNRLRDAGRIKGVKPLVAESAEEIASLAESEGTTSFSLVRDEAKIAELEASPKRIGYRNVILNEDGSFSSPMATHIGNTGKGKVKSATFNLGEWEEAEENPQLVDEQGKVYIYKDNGGSVKVAYDPYIHNRLDKVNAQFKEAWKRPNLVYVETEVPITDLESGYHADKAKLPVGVHSWSNGDLMLSRYDKPIRIVPWEEVADDWVARFKDRGVEFDIVPPALLPILKERGVEILPPHKGLGADATEAYEASRTEQESFSLVRPTDEEVTFDNFYTNTSVVFEKVSETPSGRPDFVSKSGSRYWYGEDEGGKYVIRQSNHWSANVTTEEAKDAFNSKPDNYNNIASCYWALEGAENQPTTIELGTINKANVLNVDYNTDTHRLTITLKGGRRVYRDGVSVRDMRKYFNLMKSQGATAANDYVVDMVNEKYAEVVKPADKVQIGKAYLSDFTKWEVEPRESFSILRDEDTDTIFATAKEEFASTNDWKKTGWLMPDGTQLDFAEGGDYRGTDHRAIGAAYKGKAEHQWQYLQDFESRGGIRIHMNRDGKYGTIEMTIKPTAEQKKRLRSFIGAVGGNVDVDFMDENYNTAHSASYEGVSPARVLSGITNFYDEGIKPKGNVSYSVERERADIERVAKADGTWLKAPNGKDTNLSPEQWVTVRTEAFKAWFGDWENDPENASKVVDENGEPKVVYHGTPHQFYVFGENTEVEKHSWSNEGTFFFSDSMANARTYGANTMGVFLNIRNPYKYDFEGRSWRNVKEGIAVRYSRDDSNLASNFSTKKEAEEWLENFIKENPGDYRVQDSGGVYLRVAEHAFLGKAGLTTDEQALFAKENGYEGVIQYNIVDTAGGEWVLDKGLRWTMEHTEDSEEYLKPHNNYVVFNPNQIKSATENIGTFDSANDDIRYSLNRDDVTIATPEMEAEANEELSKEAKLLAELDDAQNAYDRLVRKLKAVADRKELTFDEVRKFFLDESVMEGLQEASAGQYRRIIRNVLNVLEKTPNKRIKVESLASRIQEELLSARLNVANSALKAAGKDFKKLITKKREGRNTRGEAIAKYVDNETRNAVGLFVDIIEYAYKNSDGKVMWDNALLAGRAFGEGVVTIDKVLDDDEINGETLPAITRNLLFVYKYLRDRAVDVDTALNNQQSTASEIEQVETKIATLQKLVETFKTGGRGFGDALRELKAMGYHTIPVAENAIENLYAIRKQLRKEMRDHKSAEARAKSQLVYAIKYMNTALLGVDKKGRIALKAEQAEKKEKQGKFKAGIFRSVRSPHYKNVGYKEEYIDEMSYGKRRNIRRRGKVFWADVAETLEFLSRRIDRMSIPNEWLQDGWYYQFILHPTEGVLARADWRYKTEKALREQLNEKARELFAPDKKKGKFTIDDLKYKLKSKSGITVEILKTSVTGKPQHKAVKQTIELTLGQLLYMRAMNAQEGGILGLITNGLTPSKVAQIVEYAEREYPQFCEFDDWIRGEDGILEQIYQIRNEIYRSINGVDLDHTEGYFPIQRKSDEVHKEEDVGNAINVATIAGGIGSNKKRVRNSVPIDITVDYFEKLDQHISESIQWCAAAELIEKVNALLSSKQFRQILEAQGFDKEAIKNSFKRAIGERLQTTEGKETDVDRTVTSISKNMVAANVAFNLNSALKQLVSLSASFSNEFNLKLLGYFARNLFLPSALMSDIKDMDLWNKDDSHFEKVVSLAKLRGCHRWAKENIPTYAERVDSANMGYDIFEQDGIDSWDRVSNWFKEKGMKANVYMDSVACAVLTKTYYDYQYERNKERGMSHQEAHDDARMRAANIMNQTQQSSQGAYMSKYQADKLIGAQAFVRAFFMAYQNSQLGFDRNARAAYQNLATMMYDVFGKEKGNSMKLMIKYQSDQYIARGIKKSKARKMAVADYRRSFFTQLNTLLHNMVLNNVLWTASSVLSANIARMMAAVGLMFKGSDYDDEPTEITFEAIWDDVKQELRKSWWLYAIPYSQTVLAKSFVDTVAGAMTADDANSFKAQHTIGGQVINDLLGSIQKAITSFDYASDEEKKAQNTLVVLGLIDAASRVGLGISTRTLIRMLGGVAGIAGDGEAEHYMNLLSSPRYLTKAVAGRPRKGETMKQYTERLGGAYKIINGNLKGEDVSKLRKQYIDRMDELMFYGTDFDYDKFKEDKSMVNKYTKRLPITPKGQLKEGLQAPTPEDFWKIGFMYNLASYAEKSERTLSHPMKCNWDNDGANERRELYELADVYVQTFYRIKDAKSEEDIREILSVLVEVTNKRSLPQLEAAGIKNVEDVLLDVDEMMQAREEVIEGRKNINK